MNFDKFYKSINKYKTFLLLIGIVFVFSCLSEYFFQTRNIINIIRQVSIIGILSVGMTLVIITGGIDLSVGSLLAVGGMVTASMVKAELVPLWLAMGAGILSGGFLGFINGIIISKFNVPPFVVTLSMMSIARGITYIYSDGKPIISFKNDFLIIGQGYLGLIPVSVIIFFIVTGIALWLLEFTKIGRHIYAIGGKEEAAYVCGIAVTEIKTLVYTIMGLLASLSGIMLASRINSAHPQAGLGYELDAIAAVVIGGTSLMGGVGMVSGTIMGALIIGVINNGLNLLGVTPYFQMVVKGIIIISAVMVDKQFKK